MSVNPVERPDGDRETQQAPKEATERVMRLQVWLNGLLAGGPPLAEAVKPWREGLPIYSGPAETFAEGQNEVPEYDVKLVEESLIAACSRLRERRAQSGKPLPGLGEEEHRRRLMEVLDAVQAGHRVGEEFTPMHIVLASRYIEGIIDSEDYLSRRKILCKNSSGTA
jgi:hypothetical protein